MKRNILLLLILFFALTLTSCSSEKSDEETATSVKDKPKVEQKESICDIVEKDAFSAEKAVRIYFSNPHNDRMPQLSDLKDLSPKNITLIEGDLEQIKIVVSSENGACDKGEKFIISIPKGEKDGWQL